MNTLDRYYVFSIQRQNAHSRFQLNESVLIHQVQANFLIFLRMDFCRYY